MPNLFSRLFGGHEKPNPETMPLVPATEQDHPSFYGQQGRVRELLDRAVPGYMDYEQLAVRLMAQQAEASGKQFHYDKDQFDHYTKRIEAIHKGEVTDPSVEELRLIASAFTDSPDECIESDVACKVVCSQIDFQKSVLHHPGQFTTTEVSPDVQVLSSETIVSDKDISTDDLNAITEVLRHKHGGNLTDADLSRGKYIRIESPEGTSPEEVNTALAEVLKHKSLQDITDADLPAGMHIATESSEVGKAPQHNQIEDLPPGTYIIEGPSEGASDADINEANRRMLEDAGVSVDELGLSPEEINQVVRETLRATSKHRAEDEEGK